MTSSGPARVAHRTLHTARRFRKWSRDSSPSGTMRATRRRGRAPHGSSGILNACSRISLTIFRCCDHSWIAAPEGRSDCRCPAGAMNAFQRHCSRVCRSAMNPLAKEAPRRQREVSLRPHRRVLLHQRWSRRPVRERRNLPPEISRCPEMNLRRAARSNLRCRSPRRLGRSTWLADDGGRRGTVCWSSSSRVRLIRD